MTADYAQATYNDCKCGAHAQHRFLSYRFFHPSATLKDASVELRISYNYARLLWSRLRKRKDYGKICPICGLPALADVPSLSGGTLSRTCRNCGFEPGEDLVLEEDPAAQHPVNGWSSPVHRILPDRGLGGRLTTGNIATLARRTMYHGEKIDLPLIRKHASNLSHMTEVKEDNLTKGVRSLVLQELKSTYPDDGVSDLAARLISEEVRTFRSSYPRLSAPKGLKEQLASNVMRRLELMYPRLGRTRNSATPVLEAVKS